MNGTAKYSTETSIDTSSSGSSRTPSAIHSLRAGAGRVGLAADHGGWFHDKLLRCVQDRLCTQEQPCTT